METIDGIVERFDTDSDEFMAIVEEAWYARTKGDLALIDNGDPMGCDRDARDLAERMAFHAVEVIAASGQVQVDADGNDLRLVTKEEIARRICVALDALCAGGVK